VRYFGKQAANPRQYIEMNWAAEPWTRGCYVGFTPPGVLLDYGPAITAPVGRIHWAGAETSDFWNGYMDGAVRSGERAASEALHDL
jgi:monoamine oxidase